MTEKVRKSEIDHKTEIGWEEENHFLDNFLERELY